MGVMEMRRRLLMMSQNVVNINIWDEQWETGKYDSDGNKTSASGQIRTANVIPVEPDTQYYAYIGKDYILGVYFLKEDASVISYNGLKNQTFTTPSNCKYINFFTQRGYGGTYTYDISINYPSTDHDYHRHI